MPKTLTNLNGSDLSFMNGENDYVVIRNTDSVEVSDKDAAMLEKHPAFKGLMADGKVTLVGKAGRPSNDAKAKAEAEAAEKAAAEKAAAEAAAAAAAQGQQ